MNKLKNKSWKIGETVKVGFLMFTVLEHKGSDTLLKHKNGKLYLFTPYQGINEYREGL